MWGEVLLGESTDMSIKEQKFWRECEKYHDLAEQFDRNIEITHPDYVKNWDRWCTYSTWGTTAVVYYEYRGERI